MAVITHHRSKGPLGAGVMRGHTASTYRGWGTVITRPHHGRRAQTGRRPGFGPGGIGKAGVEYLLFQPDRGNVRPATISDQPGEDRPRQ